MKSIAPIVFLMLSACVPPRTANRMYWQGRIDEAAWTTNRLSECDHLELADAKWLIKAHQTTLLMKSLYAPDPFRPNREEGY